MTKEEAIKIIEYTFLNADGHLKPLDFDYEGGKGIVEALRMAIEALSQSSLPSNLDEAAEEYALDVKAKPFGGLVEDAFKAGAEWMAGQGASYNTEVGWIDGPTVLDWPDNILDGFKMGDEVIVQIRKK